IVGDLRGAEDAIEIPCPGKSHMPTGVEAPPDRGQLVIVGNGPWRPCPICKGWECCHTHTRQNSKSQYSAARVHAEFSLLFFLPLPRVPPQTSSGRPTLCPR